MRRGKAQVCPVHLSAGWHDMVVLAALAPVPSGIGVGVRFPPRPAEGCSCGGRNADDDVGKLQLCSLQHNCWAAPGIFLTCMRMHNNLKIICFFLLANGCLTVGFWFGLGS